jgi:hypothetical protein
MLLFSTFIDRYLCAVRQFTQENMMKKFLSMLAVVFTVGLSTVAMEAEAAKRMGSGKSMGTQRQMTQDKAPTTPAQSAAAAPAAGGAAAAATPSRSWMGPVAGLAAGLGLAALASHFGFGDELFPAQARRGTGRRPQGSSGHAVRPCQPGSSAH